MRRYKAAKSSRITQIQESAITSYLASLKKIPLYTFVVFINAPVTSFIIPQLDEVREDYSNVLVFVNSVLLRPEFDYKIQGQYIFLSDLPEYGSRVEITIDPYTVAAYEEESKYNIIQRAKSCE